MRSVKTKNRGPGRKFAHRRNVFAITTDATKPASPLATKSAVQV